MPHRHPEDLLAQCPVQIAHQASITGEDANTLAAEVLEMLAPSLAATAASADSIEHGLLHARRRAAIERVLAEPARGLDETRLAMLRDRVVAIVDEQWRFTLAIDPKASGDWVKARCGIEVLEGDALARTAFFVRMAIEGEAARLRPRTLAWPASLPAGSEGEAQALTGLAIQARHFELDAGFRTLLARIEPEAYWQAATAFRVLRRELWAPLQAALAFEAGDPDERVGYQRRFASALRAAEQAAANPMTRERCAAVRIWVDAEIAAHDEARADEAKRQALLDARLGRWGEQISATFQAAAEQGRLARSDRLALLRQRRAGVLTLTEIERYLALIHPEYARAYWYYWRARETLRQHCQA